MALFYACDGKDETTIGGRCRKPAEKNGGCAEHPQGQGQPASPPTRVTVKLSVPDSLLDHNLKNLALLNNRNNQESFSRQRGPTINFLAEAERRGIDPWYYRRDVPDLGTIPLFTAESVHAHPYTYKVPILTVMDLIPEVFGQMGLRYLQGWYPKQFEGETIFVLQADFSDLTPAGEIADQILSSLGGDTLERCIDQLSGPLSHSYEVWIYENPASEDATGRGGVYVPCTVNATFARDQSIEPHGTLHFTKERRWMVEQ